ncbi:MBL fold metallo-hydrolase [Candidatus Peregrinibacteria bacterium CG_4_10_14_0_2_um_filter_43_11]|nr:MAG: MBL fold metallo-hydrolase [Candidatus Peregrinibacteria bacterium CG_4_10_14_0_2_um_filter_43_11]
MKLTSFGAALEVTGSQHLLEINGKRILLDCGLFQGRRKESFEKNHTFGFDPTKIDAVVLSHAHIDHSGNIPTLVKRGFKGIIHCTEATHSLCEVMLMDSAYIQESDAAYFARKHPNTALTPIEPLYTQEDAEAALEHFNGKPYNKTFELIEGVKVTFREAGHVLGSAIVVLEIEDKEDGKKKRFVFTGDLGRKRLPILKDPYQVETADYLMCESTYGNRAHEPIEESLPALARVVNRTARRGGKIIIPSFALERTQELIYSLHALIDEDKIPKNISIFIDSPLANKVTGIFKKHAELYDEEVRSQFKGIHNPFEMKQLKHVESVDESKKLNYFIGPCIIISASGMCEAGRIRHHLRNNIEDPKNTIAIVGYQAENTLGRKLVNNDPAVKIFDEMFSVKAEVVVLESFSAHADMNDLDDYIKNVKNMKKVILVHGEIDQSSVLAERTRKNTGTETIIMEPQKAITL